MGDGAAENEAARLDAGHLVDLAAGPGMHQLVDGAAKGARVAKKRGDVAKHDARLGIIRDVADRGFQIVVNLTWRSSWSEPQTRLRNFRGDAAGRTVANHGDRRNPNATGAKSGALTRQAAAWHQARAP